MPRVTVWRRWTAPVGEGEVARRREAVLFSVLAAFVVLSLVTQVIQLARLAAHGRLETLAFWLLNVVLLGVFAGLLRLARGGRPRAAAGVLLGIVGSLALVLLLGEGVDRAMWAVLGCLYGILAAVLIGGRGAWAWIGGLSALAVTVLGLQDAGVIEPLLTGELRRGTDFGGAIGVVVVIAFVGFVCWTYTREQVESVDQALTRGAPGSPLRRLRSRHLSPREVEVVRLVAAGMSNVEIARRLFVSPRTVQTHVANAMRKTEAANRTALGVLAVREGLVPLAEDGEEAPAGAVSETAA